MATDTETAEEVPFEEKFGDLVSARTQALRDLRYHKSTGFQKGVTDAATRAAESYTGMVSSTASHLLGKSQQEKADLLEQLGKVGALKSSYGIESVGFNPEAFKEDVQKALEATEEKAKEPSPV